MSNMSGTVGSIIDPTTGEQLGGFGDWLVNISLEYDEDKELHQTARMRMWTLETSRYWFFKRPTGPIDVLAIDQFGKGAWKSQGIIVGPVNFKPDVMIDGPLDISGSREWQATKKAEIKE